MRLFVVVLPQVQFASAKTWPNNLKLAVEDTVTHGRYFHIRERWKYFCNTDHFNLSFFYFVIALRKQVYQISLYQARIFSIAHTGDIFKI